MALLPADFLGGVFGDRVIICGQHRISIFDIELFLSGFGFTLGIFNRDAGRVEMVVAAAASGVLPWWSAGYGNPRYSR